MKNPDYSNGSDYLVRAASQINETHDWVKEIKEDTQHLVHLRSINVSLKLLAWTLPILVGTLGIILILKELRDTDRNFRLGNILNMDRRANE